MTRLRSAAVIIQNGQVALIERVNERGTYYLFPGGGVEAGETLEAAAIREVYEELGITVSIVELLAIVHFGESTQYYFSARLTGGRFGTGKGEELSASAESETGSYTPVWIPASQLTQRAVYPAEMSRLIAGNLLDLVDKPVVIEETRG